MRQPSAQPLLAGLRRAAAPVRGRLAALAVLIASSAGVAGQTLPTASDGASEPEQPRRVVVRFLTEGDFPPFNYLDEDGVLNGFNVDLARAVCSEIGAACDIKVRPWDELLPALQRGDADAVIAGHSVTAEALVQVAFTDRYFHTPGRFAAGTAEEKVEISPEGLDGRVVAVARGSPHEAFLKTFFRDSRIQPYETAELAREAVMQSKADFVFDDGIGLAFWINGTLSRQCCELRGGPYFEPRFFGDGLAIAVPRSDPQIKALINAALQRIRASGRFDELVSRYFPHRVF